MWNADTAALRRLIRLLLVVCACLSACNRPSASSPDAIPPTVFARPAGGVFPHLPAQLGLESTENATIYYTLDGTRPTRHSPIYSAPLSLTGDDVILRFFARDAAGNASRMRVERYRRVPRAPHIALASTAPVVLGPQHRTTVRWVCERHCDRFRLVVGDGGWEHGGQVAAGTVQDGQTVASEISAASLPVATTRLWIYVESSTGVLGAASLPLAIDRQAPRVTAWPAGGTYGTLPSVALVTDEASTVYYSTDGSSPTRASARYTAPIRLRGETTVRFLAVDRFGNQSPARTETYRLRKQAPTVGVQEFPGLELEVSSALRFTWRSSHRGHYLLSANGQPLARGRVARNTPMQSTVHGWSLDAPHNRLRLRVTDDDGQEGSTSFLLDTFVRETFARRAALDGEATTAQWDSAAGRMVLPTGPQLRGTYETRYTSRGVASQGGYAYVANTRGGLRVVDLAAVNQPRLIGSLIPYGEPKALVKYQHYVYVAAETSGVQIFDVSAPQAPLLVGHLRLPGAASAMAITGTRAYVGTPQHGLYLYDLSEPRQPGLVAHVRLDMPVVHLAVTATQAYVAGFGAGVAIIDVAVPSAPRLLATVSAGTVGASVLGVAVHEQRLYVAARALVVFDVRDPAHPRRLASLLLSGAHGVAVHDGLLYVADQYDGLRIAAADANPPQLLGTYDTPNRAVRLALQGHIAYVADVLGGLQIIDVSEPDRPVLLQALSGLGQIVDVWVEAGFAYLINRRGPARLLIADVRHPRTARIVGTYRNGSLTDVVLSGPLAYVLDAFGGLQIVDIHAPQRPHLLGARGVRGVAQGLSLYGEYALVAAGDAGLQVIDVSQPRRPATVAVLPLAGESVDVVTWGRYAYVAAGSGGIAVVDLTRPAAPQLLGSVQPPQPWEDKKIVRLAVGDAHLYASDTSPGLLVFSLAAPYRPQWLRQIPSPQGTLWALALHGPYLYATTILKHLTVFDVSDPAVPRVIGTAASGARDIAISAPYALLATESYQRRGGGLRILEIYAPVAPQASVSWSEAAFDVAATASRVYIAAGDAGLVVGRVSGADQFQPQAHLQWHDAAQRLVLCGPQAYVGGQHTLAAVDLAASTEPRLLSVLELEAPVADLACHGSLLLVAAGSRGLLVLERSDPTHVVIRATVPVRQGLHQVAVWGGGYVLGASSEGRLMLFDLTAPSHPRVAWSLDLGQPVRGLAVYGRYAYVAAGAAGLYVVPLGVAGPSPPRAIWSGEVQGLALWGRLAYVADRHRGLVSLDLADPEAPRQTEAEASPAGFATPVRPVVTGTALYVAQGRQGVRRYTLGVSRTAVRVPQATVQSFKVDAATRALASVTLWARAWPGMHGRIVYEVTNDGGDTWARVLPGISHRFAAAGNDLRWRAVLHGTTPLADPALYEIRLTYELAVSAP